MRKSKTLPGTTIPWDAQRAPGEILDGLFLGGGLYPTQAAELIGVENYMLQNWVTRGYIPSPQNKRFTKRQFCRAVIINMLRDSLNIGQITGLISKINGHLDDESDDLIDDSLLYAYFAEMLESCDSTDEKEVRSASRAAARRYDEPRPGSKQILEDVLCAMYLAYNSSLLIRRARDYIENEQKTELNH